MKSYIRPILAILVMLICVPVFADKDEGDGCKPLGSWLGYDQLGSAWWMTTSDGQSASHGTLNLEVPGAIIYFPGAFGVTELRGVWQKAGDDMVAWTVVGFAYDAAGTALALARLSGKSAFSPDCNTETISDTFLEVFAPDANVETDDPIWTAPFPDHEGHRVKLVTNDLP